MNRVIGFVIAAIGAAALYLAYQASNAPVDQAVTALTGNHTNTTLIYLVAGIAGLAGGALLIFNGRRAV